MIRPLRTIAALAIAGAALSGCAQGSRPPLYSSLETTGSFGYFHEDLGGDRIRVGYRAPIRRGYDFSRAEREREGERLVTLAYDLALLRAAEIADERGAPSFDIEDRQNDVDSTLRTAYAPDPFYPPWPYWHHHRYYDPFPFHGPVHVERSTEVAVSVTFVAELRADATGAFDTSGTLARLRQRHPEPVRAAPATP